MNPQHPPITDPEKLDEEITAYLDGELSGDQLREVEQRLATDDAYRAQLQATEQSWRLLDELPRAEVDQRFAATTVEMVAATAGDDTAGDNWGRQLLRQWAIGGFSVLAACIVGFLVTTGVAALLQSTGLVENPNQQLLQDLPILEDLDKYRLVEDIEFLRDFSRLPDTMDIAQTGDPDAKRRPPRDETIEDRRLRVERMADLKKRRLATNQERFRELKPEQQQRLRTLYAQLKNDPESDKLMTALDRYYDWYRLLTAVEHIELTSREPDARIEYIKDLREKQQAEHAERQWVLDFPPFGRWLQDVAARHERELLSQRPDGFRREFGSLPEPEKRQRLARLLWQQWDQAGRPLDPPFDEAGYLAMKAQLSQSLRDSLNEIADSEAEVKQLLNRFSDRVRKRLAGPGGRFPVAGRTDEKGMPVSDREVSRERLMDFYRKLPPDQQQRIMHLSPDDFLAQLEELYARHPAVGGRPPFRNPRGFDGKDRPGGPPRRPGGGPPDRRGFRGKGRYHEPE